LSDQKTNRLLKETQNQIKMAKEKLEYKILKDLCAELDEQARELIDYGNSKEKAEGYGMKAVTKVIELNLQSLYKTESR